ncbi:MAG: efflux RND transporter periplasmic adaptor subunit [Acidobacteria bacterium]|nr:efflux RND transporter periplasmic adaptor subunit [Acidobacteriota bacterium]
MMPTKLSVLAALLAAAAFAQSPELTAVVSRPVSRMVELPGEIQPFLAAGLHAKVNGYVERVLVDRGSAVKTGDLLIELSAPEMEAQIAEAEARVQAAGSDRAQAEAQLAAAQANYDRLRKAAETPGAVAGNEVIQAEKQVDAAKALVEARAQSVRTAEAAVRAQRDRVAYLRITAPFDGVITERLVHPGALAGPAADAVLLRLEQVSRLRVVVAVPEEYTGAIARGARVDFRVPAFPDRVFAGTVARTAHALDPGTRTMPVELDAQNPDGALAPGMYPAVKWPVRRSHPAQFVPRTAVVTTTERTFVVRAKNGRAEWVNVTKGAAEGDLIEVSGALQPGDMVVKRATDEIREGTPLR